MKPTRTSFATAGRGPTPERGRAAELCARVFADDPLFAPHALGFQFGEEIGAGAMGRVLRVRDHRLQREAALKVMLEPENPRARARFFREGRLMARLTHPGVPPVFELGTAPDGRPFLLMKLIEGRPLSDLIEDHHAAGAPTEGFDALVDIWIRLCETIAFAHEHRVLHRDLKPQNILVGEHGEVTVLDWGLARCLDEEDPDEALTVSGEILGTPGFMAPEQARGQSVDTRADIFALGAILSAILTGLPPFAGPGARALLNEAALGRVVAPRQRGVEAAEGLLDLADDALAAEPQSRPARASDLAERARAALRGGSAPRRLWLSVLVAVLAFGSGVAFTIPGGPESETSAADASSKLEPEDKPATLGEASRANRLRSLLVKGQDLLAQDKYLRAFQAFEAALAIDPEARKALRGRWLARQELDDLSGALEDADALLALDSRDARLHYERALILKKLKRNKEAAVGLSDAIDRAAADRGLLYDCHYKRGTSFYEMEAWAEAEADFSEAFRIDPESYAALFGRANARCRAGRLRESIADYTRLIALHPETPMYRVDRGLLRARLGEREAGLRDIEEGLLRARAFADTRPALALNIRRVLELVRQGRNLWPWEAFKQLKRR